MQRLVAIALFCGLAFGNAPAHAQPAPPNPNATAADAALAEGRKAYDVREWDLAIAKYKEAYKLRPDAASLFNLAQAHRLKGDCVEAAAFYRTYKRNYPMAPNIDKVDKFVEEMDACAKATPPSTTPPSTTTPPPTTPPSTTTPPPTTPPPTTPPPTTPPPTTTRPTVLPPAPAASTNSRAWMKWPGIAGLGLGTISAGLGIKFALDGNGFNDDLKTICAVSCTGAQARAIELDGESANTKAVVFAAIGGGLVLTGAVMLVMSLTRGTSSETNITVVPTSGGAAATYTHAF